MSAATNAVERLKAEKPGLAILDEIPALARSHEGWETIDPGDRERLKWAGLFYRKPTPGRFMIRLRVTGGRLSSEALRAIAGVARDYGSGKLDFTTRQGIEIRDVNISDAPVISDRLAAAGLSSLQTGMDNVRTVMTCPLAGLATSEAIDAFPVADRITRGILRNPDYADLPRKFNASATGCTGNCTPNETQDLALVPARREGATGFNILVGGKQGSGGMVPASSLDAFVMEEEAAAVAREIILLFRDHGPRGERGRCRLAFLIAAWGVERFREELVKRLGRPLSGAGEDLRARDSREDHLGVQPQRAPGLFTVGFTTGTGRVMAGELDEMARLAETFGAAEVRLTPEQNGIFVGVSEARLSPFLAEPFFSRFPYEPNPFERGLVTCVGTDYCNLALIDTKGIGAEVSRGLREVFGDNFPPISIRWSGCAAACGSHHNADLGFQGVKANVNGKLIEAVNIFVGGRGGPEARPAQKIMELVPVSMLREVVPVILRNWPLLREIRRDRDSERVLMLPAESPEEAYA